MEYGYFERRLKSKDAKIAKHLEENKRLQAEVERLNALTVVLSSERHVPAMRVAVKMQEQQVQASEDYMALVRKCDNIWNDAIEASAHLIECDGDALRGKADVAQYIRTLRK